MRRNKLYSAAMAAAVAGGLVTASAMAPSANAADSVRWKMPIAFASNLPALGTPSQYVAKHLNTMSGGKVQVRVYEPGKLVPPFDILDAVSSGKVGAGYTWIGYDQGKIPSLPLFSAVPFGLKPWAFTAWYYHGGGQEMLQEVYANKGYNVHAELCGLMGPETAGWYAKPIKSLDDYKGLKIRFAGLGGKVLERAGASVTMMPGGELFQALETGTIDATEFSMPAIDQILGFDKVVKYNLFPGWHQTFTALHMLINGDEWKNASEETRDLVETTCTAATLMGFSEGEYKNGKVLAGFQEKGVHNELIPRKVLEQLKELTDQVLAEEAENDADFKRVYESQKAFAKTYELWDKRAYLPSDL
ncbi:MAG: TRAP transporter substrate-binding protein [Ectothiorhodospiraceae bacterium]|jgi:TRAP-type mannitol/chloroaromatic compound transport system substrate-binding protein